MFPILLRDNPSVIMIPVNWTGVQIPNNIAELKPRICFLLGQSG